MRWGLPELQAGVIGAAHRARLTEAVPGYLAPNLRLDPSEVEPEPERPRAVRPLDDRLAEGPEHARPGDHLLRVPSAAEDVGERFAEEVRRVHYGESEERSLRGQASRDEVEELLDEGIAVLPVPPADDPLH